MFKVEKSQGKAVLTVYGFVGGMYLESRNIAAVLDDISASGISQLDIHVHTYGGSVFDGNLIYNFLSSFRGSIDIYIDGLAASMGSIFIMAVPAAKIHIAENGFLMIHSPSTFEGGRWQDLIAAAKLLKSMEKNFIKKLSERLEKNEEVIVKQYFDGVNHWIDAKEAVALGLVNDTFEYKNGAITFSKEDIKSLDVETVYNKYMALAHPENFPQNTDTMNKILMKLELPDGTPEDTAAEAVEALKVKAQQEKERADAAELELSNYKAAEAQKAKAALDAESDTIIAEAAKDGRISLDAEGKVKAFYKKAFEADPEGTREVIANLPKHESPRGNAGAQPESAWDKRQKELSGKRK